MDQLKKEQVQLLPYQEKSIQSLTAKRDNHLYLASITNHSKKRKRHLDGAQFYDEVIADAYEEYANMNGEMED
ncbi:hypothetical protein NSQ62_07975 [Solibacillus sp. FSL H8-0523]|uniref:hypothetical protein n=1 Tax=Solibacillus sp. FSL H8-0523 TaxID=2954511 RepID=UPI0031014410